MSVVMETQSKTEPRTEPSVKPASNQGRTSIAVLNFWLDAGLFVNIIFVMWVSVMLRLVFPPATEAAGWTVWGLSYNDWQTVQFYSLCLFALLAVEHLVLHWNWVCSILATRILRSREKPDEGVQAVYGVGTFITILVLVMGTLLIAMATATHPRL